MFSLFHFFVISININDSNESVYKNSIVPGKGADILYVKFNDKSHLVCGNHSNRIVENISAQCIPSRNPNQLMLKVFQMFPQPMESFPRGNNQNGIICKIHWAIFG